MEKGLLATLFDFSFSEFVTTRVIRFVFGLGVVFSGIGALALLVGGFSNGFGSGLLMLILSPLAFLLYVLGVRIWCEIIIVMFRIAENTSRMVDQKQEKSVTE
jgi:hypothetical protein